MARVKPCATCGHPKSWHRVGDCRYTWQAMGQTFMGNRIVTKWCTCRGYQSKEGDRDHPRDGDWLTCGASQVDSGFPL